MVCYYGDAVSPLEQTHRGFSGGRRCVAGGTEVSELVREAGGAGLRRLHLPASPGLGGRRSPNGAAEAYNASQRVSHDSA